MLTSRSRARRPAPDDPGSRTSSPGRRGAVVAAALALLVVGGTGPATAAPAGPASDGGGGAGRGWASGAAGNGVADGSFAEWRGSDVPIAGTWVDSNAGQLGLWPLRPGGEYATWTGDLDIAVGAIDRGESWSAAARGAYDDRWEQSLTELARLWEGRPGTLYIRFAHEFNGDWYPWQVRGEETGDFRTAWGRYRALQQEHFPEAQLVLSPSSDTSAGLDLDWREAFPGARQVDVLSVDYYNAWPWTDTAAEFRRAARATDRFGAPRGIQRHADFAREQGVAFAVSEWGNDADLGDSPVFVQQMRAFFRSHAGDGPGRLRYEILFNVAREDGNTYGLSPRTRSPRTAAAYRRLF